MSKSIDVKIINHGKDGDTLCFRLVDSEGKVYIIDNCHLKETFSVFVGYFGSCDGVPTQLNKFANGRAGILNQ